MTITSYDYWNEVNSLAESVVEEAAQQESCDTKDSFDRDTVLEAINDRILHETIDGHSWVIYYANNLDVIQHSDNEDYLIDNLGLEEAGHCLKKGGLNGLHQAIAFWALYADVQDKIEEALDSYEENLPEADEESEE
jgi:hypothetical protein